jgi:CRISPR/Cas system endoribonuclease Cas6 (RAMP superfamily)
MCFPKKINIFESLSKYFNIYSEIVFSDAGIFFRHQAELVLRHQMRVSIYFVKFFYSV